MIIQLKFKCVTGLIIEIDKRKQKMLEYFLGGGGASPYIICTICFMSFKFVSVYVYAHCSVVDLRVFSICI